MDWRGTCDSAGADCGGAGSVEEDGGAGTVGQSDGKNSLQTQDLRDERSFGTAMEGQC